MYEITKVGVHNPSRVRAYVSEEAADQDADRPTTDLPQGNDHGLILDLMISDPLELELNPVARTPIHPQELIWRASAYTTIWFDFRPLEEYRINEHGQSDESVGTGS